MANSEPLTSIYRRYIACCNEYRFDDLDEFVAEDVNGPDEDRTTYIAGVREVVEAFPDYHWEPQLVLVDGPWLAVRLYGSGTHRGTFRGVPPTGRWIRTQELVIYRIEDGQITQCWGDLHTTVRDELVSGGNP